LLKTLGRHPGAKLFELFGDGRVLTVDPAAEAWLWDGTGQRLQSWAISARGSLPSQGRSIISSHSVLLSRWGTRTALVTGDASWYVWDIDDQAAPRRLEPGLNFSEMRLLSRDQALVVEREGIALLDLTSGHVRRLSGSKPGHPWIVHSKGSVIGCQGKTLQIIELESGHLDACEMEHAPTCLVERADGDRLVVGTDEGTVEIWDLDGQIPVRTSSFANSGGSHVIELGPSGRSYYQPGASHDSPVTALAEDGEEVWSASTYWNGTLKRWDGRSGACLETIPLGLDGVNGLHLLPGGGLVATSFRGAMQRLVGSESTGSRRLLGAPDLLPEKARVNATRRIAVSLDEYGWLRHWDLLDQNEPRQREPEPGRPLAFSDDGRYLLTEHGLVETRNRWELFSSRGNREISMSRDGQTVVSVNHQGAVSVWRAEAVVEWRDKDAKVADFSWQIEGAGNTGSRKPQPDFDGHGRLWARHREAGSVAYEMRHFLRCHEPCSGVVQAEIESAGPEQYASKMYYHSSLPLALSAGGSKAIGVWSLDRLTVRALELDVSVASAALHPKLPVAALVVGEFREPPRLRLLQLETGEILAQWELPLAQSPQVAFLDSQRVVCVGCGPNLLEFEMGHEAPRVLWRAETDLVALAVSARGDLAVFGWGCLDLMMAPAD
jgi:WD40 repeat protein